MKTQTLKYLGHVNYHNILERTMMEGWLLEGGTRENQCQREHNIDDTLGMSVFEAGWLPTSQ